MAHRDLFPVRREKRTRQTSVRHPRGMRLSTAHPIRAFAVLAALIAAGLAASAPASAAEVPDPPWAWPGGVAEVTDGYRAPDHEYGPGHRGIDVAVAGDDIVAPAAGTVAFAGRVADRPLLTIDHGDGLVSTLEPVDPTVAAGERVARGQVVGSLADGGHAPPGSVHLGARLNGDYIDPLGLLGALERPVLLPCC